MSGFGSGFEDFCEEGVSFEHVKTISSQNHKSNVSSILFMSPDTLVCGHVCGSILFWDISKNKLNDLLEFPETPSKLVSYDENKFMVIGTGTVEAYSVSPASRLFRLFQTPSVNTYSSRRVKIGINGFIKMGDICFLSTEGGRLVVLKYSTRTVIKNIWIKGRKVEENTQMIVSNKYSDCFYFKKEKDNSFAHLLKYHSKDERTSTERIFSCKTNYCINGIQIFSTSSKNEILCSSSRYSRVLLFRTDREVNAPFHAFDTFEKVTNIHLFQRMLCVSEYSLWRKLGNMEIFSIDYEDVQKRMKWKKIVLEKIDHGRFEKEKSTMNFIECFDHNNNNTSFSIATNFGDEVYIYGVEGIDYRLGKNKEASEDLLERITFMQENILYEEMESESIGKIFILNCKDLYFFKSLMI